MLIPAHPRHAVDTGFDWVFWSLLAAMLVLLVLPLVLVPVPPLLDYPNHLARMVVLAFGAHDPFLSQIYMQHWDLIPNIGTDVVMPPLLWIMPVYVAGQVMLGVTLILPVLGTIAYSRAVLGQRSYWSLGAGFVAYNVIFILGFMNFLVSLGLALLAAAAWVHWSERYRLRMTAALIIVAPLIFLTHLLGSLFLGLLIFCHDVTSRPWGQPRAVRRDAAVRFGTGSLIFLIPALLYARSRAGFGSAATIWATPHDKLLFLFAPFLNYLWRPDLALGLLIGAVVLACVVTRRATFAPETVLAAVILLLLYAVVPAVMDGAPFAIRLSVMLGFLVFAGFTPPGLGQFIGPALGICLGGVFLLRMALLMSIWSGQNDDIASLRQVIAHVPEHSRVVAMSVHAADNPTYWHAMPARRFLADGFLTTEHLPALVTVDRDSMWPLLFSRDGRQPISVLPAYRGLTAGEGLLHDYHLLATDQPGPAMTSDLPYLADWTRKFDYVLVMLAGGATDLETFRPDRLELLARSDIAALFRVRSEATAAAPSPVSR